MHNQNVAVSFQLPASRDKNIQVPVSVTLPANTGNERFPGVIIVHGFLGSKDENGLYYGDQNETGIYSLSMQLSDLGIGSMRIDQPGCGESQDDLKNYTLENILSDLNDAYRYCLENWAFDPDRIGLVGHSMGGKTGSLFVSQHPEISTMVLLNPAGDNGSTSLLTAINAGLDYKALEAEAAEGRKDILNRVLTDFIGVDVYMSSDFITQVNASKTGDEIKTFIENGNNGLLIYGDSDNVINPDTYSWLIENTDILYACIPGMGHEMGLDTGNTRVANLIATITASYLNRFLK